MAWQYKLLARDGKLLTRAGKAVVLTAANRGAIEDCCCGDPCASGCGYIDLAGPWGVWRLNRRGDLDPDNPNFYDYIGEDGQAGIGADGAGFAAWDAGRIHCSFQVSCDGDKTVVACVACYDLDSYDPVPCPGLSMAGGCYAPCCSCGMPINDFPDTVTMTVTASCPYYSPQSLTKTYALYSRTATEVVWRTQSQWGYPVSARANATATAFGFSLSDFFSATGTPPDGFYNFSPASVGWSKACDPQCLEGYAPAMRGGSIVYQTQAGYMGGGPDYAVHLYPLTIVLSW